jgi:hypothetical protein
VHDGVKISESKIVCFQTKGMKSSSYVRALAEITDDPDPPCILSHLPQTSKSLSEFGIAHQICRERLVLRSTSHGTSKSLHSGFAQRPSCECHTLAATKQEPWTDLPQSLSSSNTGTVRRQHWIDEPICGLDQHDP